MLAIVLVYAFLYLTILHWAPVECQGLGCLGSMKRTMSRISFLKTKVTYRCDSCGETYEAEIIYPDITVEVSG